MFMSQLEEKIFFRNLKQQIDRSNIVVIVLSNTMYNTIHSEYTFEASENGRIKPHIIDEVYEEKKVVSSTVKKDIRDSDPYSADRIWGNNFESNNFRDDLAGSRVKQGHVELPSSSQQQRQFSDPIHNGDYDYNGNSNDNTIHDGGKSNGTAGVGTGEGNRN